MALDSNSKQRIPELFQEIMRIDDELAVFFEVIDFNRFSKLLKRKAELRKAAEIALQWNHNKGNSGNG